MTTPEQRTAMGRKIVDFEAQRDAKGRIKLYRLPKNDGGGLEEIAGLNSKYNSRELARLKALLEAGKYDQVEAEAAEFILKDTDLAAKLATVPAVEFVLRDIAFNRGPTGLAKTLQKAVHADIDGKIGRQTRAALAKAERYPEQLIGLLQLARAWYESEVVGVRPNFMKGLRARWQKATDYARSLL